MQKDEICEVMVEFVKLFHKKNSLGHYFLIVTNTRYEVVEKELKILDWSNGNRLKLLRNANKLDVLRYFQHLHLYIAQVKQTFSSEQMRKLRQLDHQVWKIVCEDLEELRTHEELECAKEHQKTEQMLADLFPSLYPTIPGIEVKEREKEQQSFRHSVREYGD